MLHILIKGYLEKEEERYERRREKGGRRRGRRGREKDIGGEGRREEN